MPAKKTTKKPVAKKIYVGRFDPSGFVRTFEESETLEDEFMYEVFKSATTPTKKSHSTYNAVIGPFSTVAGACVFQSREGVNTVDEAERIAANERT